MKAEPCQPETLNEFSKRISNLDKPQLEELLEDYTKALYLGRYSLDRCERIRSEISYQSSSRAPRPAY